MTKKLYIKPETILMEIEESLALLQTSKENPTGSTNNTKDEVVFQSKEHDFGYNTWEDWDNSGSTVWDDKASSLWD